jgi:hypothetical protein
MGKNSDTKNIFDSYFGEVLLKEAVKPTENAGGNSTPTYDNDPNFLKAALKNPNLDAETKGKLENRLKQLESGSNNPPAGTMTVDQAKQVIANQQAQNTVPSQGTVVNAPDVSSSATNSPVAKTRGEAAALRDQGKSFTTTANPTINPEAEYNKKLGRTPGKFDADNFNNVDRVGNDKRFPELAAYKKQLQSGQVPVQTASPATTQAASPTSQPQQSGVSLTDPNSMSLGGSAAPQAQQSSGANINDPNSVSLGAQSAKPADDFQKKLDADYAKFKNGTQATQPAATQPATKSSGGGSVVNYLAGSGQASDFGSRSKLAAQYGIQNYKGTAEQNTQLLNKLKANEKMPQGTNATGEQQYANKTVPKATAANKPSSGGQQQGMGGAVGGVSKAVGSAGQGLKQATIGTKKPLGGVLGGISKAVGSAGKGIKKALVGDQEETEKKEESEEGFVQFEKTNIAKFLKCLSEKNYAEANKYLKNIVDYKVKKKLLVSIK